MRNQLLALFAAFVLAACADDGVGPRRAPSTQGQAFGIPLAVENRWTYDVTFNVTFTRENGTKAREPRHLIATATREIVGIETIGEREYAVEEFVTEAENEPTLTAWRRLRQDAHGLYQADLSAQISPGEVPPDAEITDLVLLKVPVKVGDTWSLYPGGGALYTVEARDTISLATGIFPAWRVRVDRPNAGPDDYNYQWYGVEGLLRREAHTELDASDATGEIVHIVTHAVEELATLRLVGTGAAP